MTSRLLFALLAIGVSAQGLDPVVLVQKGIRRITQDPVIVLQQGGRTAATSRQTVLGLAYALMSDGKRWSNLLWKNNTPASVPVGMHASCSAGDRQAVEDSVQKFKEDLSRNLAEAMPKIMRSMGNGGMPAVPMVPFSGGDDMVGGMPIPVNIGDLIKNLPASCENVAKSTGDLNWAEIKTCILQATHVSETCLQCVPQFAEQISSTCGPQCETSLTAAGDSIENTLHEVQSKISKSRGFGGMPSQEEMMSVADSLTTAVNAAIQKVFPCAECLKPKAVTFAGCVLGEAAGHDAEEMLGDVLEGIKSGDMVKVQVGPDNAGGEDAWRGSSSETMPM